MSGLVMLLSPEKLKLSENTDLKVFTFNDAFGQPKPQVDISNIIALEESVVDEEQDDSKEEHTVKKVSKPVNYKEDVSEKLRDFKVPIQFPEGDQKALDHFFNSLRELSGKNELIRIVHYGDSQLEGDRISNYL
ncbi:MAG: hypothetical protein CMO01_16210, partial [Thalassobius sp.]|nr:hypothetical protein [Thalassovita sp.]